MGIGARAREAWLPTIFIRQYGLTSAEAGAALSFAGMFGLGAVLCGGCLADALSQRYGDGAHVRLISYPGSLGYALYAFSLWMPGPLSAIAMLVVAEVAVGLASASIVTLPQSLARDESRAIASGLTSLAVNSLGGLGPWLAGLFSDMMAEQQRAWDGAPADARDTAHSLRLAVTVASLASAVALASFACSARAMDRLSKGQGAEVVVLI